MTVLVVDDQIHVVEGILEGVSWQRLGVSQVWKAYSAAEAKELLLLNRVDIMLCDIEMPGENGLSLFKWTKEQEMELECIFLTAHADFTYARTAMKLESFDYILQPARYEEIENAILRARQKLLKKREQKKYYSYGKTLFEERNQIMDHWMYEWYQEPENEERCLKLLEGMQKMGDSVYAFTPVSLILCHVVEWCNMAWEKDLFRYSCINILEELLQEYMQQVSIGSVSDCEFVFLIYGGKEKQPREQELLCALQKFYLTAQKFFECRLTLYADGRKAFEKTPGVLTKLKRDRINNVAQKTGIYGEREEKEDREIIKPDFKTWEKLLVQGMGKTVYEEAAAYLQKTADAGRLDARALQIFYNDFYRVVSLAQEKTDSVWEDIFLEEKQRDYVLHAYETLQDMLTFLKTVTAFFTEEEKDAGRAVRLVNEIKEYIHRNLESDIRREDIALSVFMNPNYVSRLFKKVEGISLKEYIVQEKMAMARALLQNSLLPVSIVALKVGYNNFSHFSQVYRKTFGISPTDERKK